MNVDNLIDAFGDIEDEYILEASTIKRPRKKIWISWATVGSLAACFLLLFLLPNFRQSGDKLGMAPNNTEEGLYMDISVSYVSDGTIKQDVEYLPSDPEEIFEVWKEKNQIGDDVVLVEVEIKKYTASWVESEGESDTSLDADTSQDTDENSNLQVPNLENQDGYQVLNIVVSENMRDYYDKLDEELLIKSLKETLMGYSGMEFAECRIRFE